MHFGKRKGQAFETMMLVISVIVALAILGVLLNILGGVGGLFNPSNPVDSIQKELLRIGGTYSPGASPVEVKLTKDQTIDSRLVTQGNPNILEDELVFAVHDSLQDSVESTGENRIKVTRDVQAVIVVCGDPVNAKYVVALGRPASAGEVADLCRSTAGIE